MTNPTLSIRVPEALAAHIRGAGGSEYVIALVEADIDHRAVAEDPAAWVAALVQDATLEVEQAWQSLRVAGWTREQLRAACAVLNGCELLPYHEGAVALELYDGQRLNRTADSHEATDWAMRVQACVDDPEQARAVWLVARDFWRRGPMGRRLAS